MATKSISVSVRMTNEELAMLSELDLPGSVTPSDKIRALVKNAHRAQAKFGDFDLAYEAEMARFAGAQHGLRKSEANLRIHSEFLVRLLSWLPDANAVVLSSIDAQGLEVKELEALEDATSDRALALLLGLVNGFLAPEEYWYGGSKSERRLKALVDAIGIVQQLRNKTTGTGAG